MVLNLALELSMVLDGEHFQKILARVYNKDPYLVEIDNEYLNTSLAEKGITTIYRDSRYKKKVRLLVNTSLVVDDVTDTDRLLRKLDKRIDEYFNHKYRINDFTLSGMNLVVNIDVGSRANVSAYLKVLKRIGKVKGFSPVYDCLDEKTSFCPSGNSNNIDFLIYDLEKAVTGQLQNADEKRKKIHSARERAKGVLRAD